MAAADARRIREHCPRSSTCRSSRATRGTRDAEVRADVRAPADSRVALLSFGGYGVRDVDLGRLDCLDRYVVLLTHDGRSTTGAGGVRCLVEPDLLRRGPATTRISSRPWTSSSPSRATGSSPSASPTTPRSLHVARTVRGVRSLVREMPRYLRCGFIDQQDLFAGRWRAALDALWRRPRLRSGRPRTARKSLRARFWSGCAARWDTLSGIRYAEAGKPEPEPVSSGDVSLEPLSVSSI